MSEIKNKALEKMLEEMNKEHNSSEDAVHNWLCDQDDEKLFEGILKEGRTIRGAMQHCMSQALKQRDGNCAMIDDPTVFGWVVQYFTDDSIPKNQNEVKAEVKITAPTKKPKSKPKKQEKAKEKVSMMEGEQLSLLDFI